MALKRPKGSAGTVVLLEHDSRILRGNPLGDPHVRKLAVWLPPQYDGSGRKRFPVLYDFVGFTGSGLAHANWKPFGDNVPERAARLIRGEAKGLDVIVLDAPHRCLWTDIPGHSRVSDFWRSRQWVSANLRPRRRSRLRVDRERLRSRDGQDSHASAQRGPRVRAVER